MVSLVYGSYEHVPISYGVGTFFDSGRLLWILMIFQQNLLSFSSLRLVFDPYEHVPISYGKRFATGNFARSARRLTFAPARRSVQN